MEEKNLSLYESIVRQPALVETLNESSDFKPTIEKNCSTPICKSSHLQTLLNSEKRKISPISNTVSKLRKLQHSDSSMKLAQKCNLHSDKETFCLRIAENKEDSAEPDAATISQPVLECLESLSQEKVEKSLDAIHEVTVTDKLVTKNILGTKPDELKPLHNCTNLPGSSLINDRIFDSVKDAKSVANLLHNDEEGCKNMAAPDLTPAATSDEDSSLQSCANVQNQDQFSSADALSKESCSNSTADVSQPSLKFNKTFCDENLLIGNKEDASSIDDNSCSSKDRLSLGMSLFDDDEVLLQSSSDEEEDINIESYYHLLDSPSESEEEDNNVTVIENPKMAKKDDYAEIAKAVEQAYSINSSQENLSAQVALSSNDLNASQTKKRSFTPRSSVLKSYIKAYKNYQQKPYPAWLEKAKKSCSQQDLENLMHTVYDPNIYNTHGRFVLESLSVNNYRQALEYSGVNPNRQPRSSMAADFYFTSPAKNYRRFGKSNK